MRKLERPIGIFMGEKMPFGEPQASIRPLGYRDRRGILLFDTSLADVNLARWREQRTLTL